MFACGNHIIVSPSLNLPRPGWNTGKERVVALTAQRQPPPYSPFSCVIFDLCCLHWVDWDSKVVWSFVSCDHVV